MSADGPQVICICISADARYVISGAYGDGSVQAFMRGFVSMSSVWFTLVPVATGHRTISRFSSRFRCLVKTRKTIIACFADVLGVLVKLFSMSLYLHFSAGFAIRFQLVSP